ncbi:hypothetical protein Scep_021869 [Stephania cephalantha]|uniref:DUF4216 domain-containing protein n=1 Tax=Stephania cephalantha TaxID=152367 RepID=A0AAP0F485_9MAGN
MSKTKKILPIFSTKFRELGSTKYDSLERSELNRIRYYVLNNCPEVMPYFDKHMEELREGNLNNVDQMQETLFPKWFEEHIKLLRHQKATEASDDLYSLACGPDPRIKRYTGCVINGIRFHTKEREKCLRTQNSGVVVPGIHQSNEVHFYGVLKDIIEVSYCLGNRVLLFKCDWWDVGNSKTGIRKDKYFTSVNTNKTWYENDPYVLASQARQVFYLNDTKLCNSWRIVREIKPRNVFDVVEVEDERRSNSEVFQEEVQDTASVGVSDEMDALQLMRNDMIPTEVDVSTSRRDDVSSVGVIIDSESDEDVEVMDYSSDENEFMSNDDDSDLE